MVEKDILLFMHAVPRVGADDLFSFKTSSGKPVRIGVIGDSRERRWQEIAENRDVDMIISANLDKPLSIAKALLPYQDQILAIVCRSEAKMSEFAKIVPHVPYLKTPNAESLVWASDKIAMRERLRMYDKKIVPGFTVVTEATKQTYDEVQKELNFPVIIKPAGLAASRLVTISYHKEEFEKDLAKIFKKIKAVYKSSKVTSKPRVLVEEFMEGSMYSIDGYVNTRGGVYFCPMTYIKTGRSIGFDDFFGYMQICPTQLSAESVDAAKKVAIKAIHALGLKNTTAHVELMRTEQGWKVIEVGARIGGFRHDMYEYSFGFSHTLNDVRIRIPLTPVIKRARKGYTVAMKFFAKKEGDLVSIRGVKKIKSLSSFKEIAVKAKRGAKCRFAKNGGTSVVDLIMFNADRSMLSADIRRVEQTLKIITE